MEHREIITKDPAFIGLLESVDRIAATKATVLIAGASGTGKELLASRIHEKSSRRNKPMIAINCAAIPENLLESELFGHEKGAFTGATTQKTGKFEIANGSTLLLDEISEMDLRLQAKLLRALQENKIDRIGGRYPISVNTRVIATTNQDLRTCVREGRFREDLYYRLNVIRLDIPRLKTRRGDISVLAKHFITKVSNAMGIDREQQKLISEGALAKLESHTWPGNVRELENIIERAVLMSRNDMILAGDIEIEPGCFSDSSETDIFSGGMTLHEIEREVILRTLKKNDDNRTHTAKELGISIRTLRNKLNEYREEGFRELIDGHIMPIQDKIGKILPSRSEWRDA